MQRVISFLIHGAAFLAMSLAVCGPLLHSPLHHSFGCDCVTEACSSADECSGTVDEGPADCSHAGSRPCAFHGRLAAAQPSTCSSVPTDDASPEPGSSHADCLVCQVLSQSVDRAELVSLPAAPEAVCAVDLRLKSLSSWLLLERPRSRGPPSV